MAFEAPVENIETDKIGGFDRVEPGSYHLEITSVDEDGGDKGEMIVKFEILRGNVPNQEGKEIAVYFTKSYKEFPLRIIHAFAIACGLITKQKLDEHKMAGTSPSYDFASCVGRQMCANFRRNEYEGKVSTRLDGDQIYYPTDKRANHIPLLMKKIVAAGIKLPEGRNPDGYTSPVKPELKKSPTTPNAANQAANVDALL